MFNYDLKIAYYQWDAIFGGKGYQKYLRVRAIIIMFNNMVLQCV